MQIELWWMEKTQDAYLTEGIEIFRKRISRYGRFDIREISMPRKSRHIPDAESQMVMSKLDKSDYLILLDERGKTMSSVGFSNMLNRFMIQSRKRIIFLIGGAHGFDQSLYDRANEQMSLSKMTFSHQMIRLLFLEQLYRAFTILNNEPYHNE
jgi:23S rRNA (pseudouridine1915-N3)-methyltransferase